MQIVGVSGDHDTCELCGKTKLKKTIVCMDDNREFHFYGCECVNKVMGTKKSRNSVIKEAEYMDYLKQNIIKDIEKRQSYNNKYEAVKIWLSSQNYRTCGSDAVILEKNNQYKAIHKAVFENVLYQLCIAELGYKEV